MRRELANLSQIYLQFPQFQQMLVDEGKDGPRLFSLQPIEPGFFDRPKWMSNRVKLTLWCEHSRQPLPALNPEDPTRGVYELELSREWLKESQGNAVRAEGAMLRELHAILKEKDPTFGGLWGASPGAK